MKRSFFISCWMSAIAWAQLPMPSTLMGGYTVPVGGLKSLTIADGTSIDPQSSIGVSGSGWVAIVVLKGVTNTGGTLDATKLSITTSDPGFDTSANATTRTRSLTGITWLRRQYPNGTSKMISTDGTDLTIYIPLTDWVYQGTTIASASIGSGFYTGSTASSAGTISNLSTVPYPNPLFAWVNPQGESTDGASSRAIEAVAFSRFAQSAQQVAAIKFNVTDGSNTSADVLVSAPALSSKITVGNIPEVWKATLDLSTLTQGAVATANAKIYPWIGTMYDVVANGVAWPTSLPMTGLRIFNDRTGAYGGAYAYVDGTGAGTPQVSATPATAKANPYASISAACTAIQTWNNSNKSHNDLGGAFVRLMDDGAGGAKTHTMAASCVNAPGTTYLTIEKDPATSAEVTITYTGTPKTPRMTRIRNLSLLAGSSAYLVNGNAEARSMLAMDNVKIDNSLNKTVVAQVATKYLLNINMIGTNQMSFNNNQTDANIATLIGCTGITTSIPDVSSKPKVLIGCSLPKFGITLDALAGGDQDDGKIIYNNYLSTLRLNSTDRAAAVITATPSPTMSYGVAVVQNLTENIVDGTGTSTGHLFADSDLTSIANVVDMHNTCVGERCSRMYNDVAATKVVPNGIIKRIASKYNIWDNYNLKTENHGGANEGSVGSWAAAYNVGNVGNVSLFGQVQRLATDSPHNDGASGVFMAHAWLTSSEYNLFRTALGYTQANIMDMFTNYTTGPRAVPARGGNYIPLSTASRLKSRVPSGMSVLVYDLAGTVRKTDGTGAAGAYEAAP